MELNRKWFLDRRNALKSKLAELTQPKLGKVLNSREIDFLTGQLRELEYIGRKFKYLENETNR